jgi:hypothetical protein
MSRTTADAPPIVVRQMGFDFEDLPRHWLGDDAFLTQLVNGLHFVFPAGERFFIRSVKRFRDQLEGELREQVTDFSAQEAQHQLEHRRAFAAIEEQGYDVQSFLEWYREVAYGRVEDMSTALMCLATTAALEHYTAVLGEFALESDFLEDCEPRMEALLKWHACEEIEHKAVTFDVLEEVSGSYPVRQLGLVLATLNLFFFWSQGVRHMMEQEPEEVRGGWVLSVVKTLVPVFARITPKILDYVRPGFHPNDHDNYELAREYLESVGRLDH